MIHDLFRVQNKIGINPNLSYTYVIVTMLNKLFITAASGQSGTSTRPCLAWSALLSISFFSVCLSDRLLIKNIKTCCSTLCYVACDFFYTSFVHCPRGANMIAHELLSSFIFISHFRQLLGYFTCCLKCLQELVKVNRGSSKFG